MHFSLQYAEWEAEYRSLDGLSDAPRRDPTGEIAVRLEVLSRKMEAVRRASRDADEALSSWIFRAATKGETYTLFQMEGAPFGRQLFYDRLRRYYFLLDKIRE